MHACSQQGLAKLMRQISVMLEQIQLRVTLGAAMPSLCLVLAASSSDLSSFVSFRVSSCFHPPFCARRTVHAPHEYACRHMLGGTILSPDIGLALCIRSI